MEKSQKPSQQPSLKPQQHTIPTLKPTTTTNYNNSNNSNKNKQQRPIWDCGSALYDSFELNSFQRELDSAIISSSRTLSMPRLPSQGGLDHHHVILQDHHVPPPPPSAKTAPAKLSRTFRKLLKSVFKPKNNNKDHYYYYYDSCPKIGPEKPPKKVVEGGGNKYFVVYEKVNALMTIPEVAEEGLSPEIGCLVRKTMSARFRSNCVGI